MVNNYNKIYLNIIKIINPCLFIYDAFILIFNYLFFFKIFFYPKGGCGTNNFIITIFINLVNILFESLVIWKLILSYKNKKGG